MNKRILILDDDPDFTSLMTDIFKQSSYDTVPFLDPKTALAALLSEHFDLLVTDHRMPGMTGEVLVRELRKTQPDLPIVVVSGFLDNDTIRDLIRDGVGGIFLKPLNVVNLLKRTATLLNEADAAGNRLPSENELEQRHRLPFDFESFPCLNERTIEFATQLHAKRAFKGMMSLIAPAGTQLEEIFHDMERFDTGAHGEFKILGHGEMTEKAILDILSTDISGKPLTLVFRSPDSAEPSVRKTIVALAAHRAPFHTYPTPRVINTFTRSVDELFEKGRIEEDFYIQASVTEIVIPALGDCEDEIPVLAARILAKHCRETGIRPALRLHKLAHSWLRERPWYGNHEELKRLITRAAESPQAGLVTRESFAHESSEHQWVGSDRGITSLESYLARLHDDYIQAALILCDGDLMLAAEATDVPPESLCTHPLVKSHHSH